MIGTMGIHEEGVIPLSSGPPTDMERAGGPVPPGYPGLTEEEATRRLSADGPNEIALSRPRSLLRLTVAVLPDPILLFRFLFPPPRAPAPPPMARSSRAPPSPWTSRC